MSTVKTPDTNDVRAMVSAALDRAGYRPFGSAGDGWEHPTGTRVTMSVYRGQVRVRRFAPGDDRFHRVPPVCWDVLDKPAESEVDQFVTPALSKSERDRIARFDAAPQVAESAYGQRLRARLVEALGDEAWADLALSVFLDEK